MMNGNGGVINVGESGGVGVLIIKDNALVQTDNLCLGGEDLFTSTSLGGTGTLYLNGGTLATAGIPYNNTTETGNIYFNGGTFQNTSNGNAWIFSWRPLNCYVQTGGAVFSNLYNSGYLIVDEQLQHDNTPDAPALDGGLTKNGIGLVLLNYNNGGAPFPANTYTGPTTVNGGTLEVLSPGQLPNYGTLNTVSVAGGATLEVRPWNGTYGWTDAQIGDLATSASWATGGILAIDTAVGNATFGGSIAQALVLAKVGANTLTLTGIGNAYSGGTTIGLGVLQIGDGSTSPGSLPGNVVISSTTAGALTFNTPAGMSVAASGNISGGGGLAMIGAGLAILSGNNSYAGSTTVAAGVLEAMTPAALPTSAGVSVSGGATLVARVGGAGEFGQSDVSSLLSAATFAPGSFLSLDTTDDSFTYAGNIGGSQGLAKLGGNALILSGNNGYTGPTTVSGGTFQIGNGGSGEYLNSPSITMSSNATVEFNHTDTYAGGYSGAISGSGQFVKAGSGSLTLNGVNSYTGPTTISGGTLVLGGSNLPTATPLTIAAAGALDMGGNSQTVGSLSGAAGAIIANNLVHPSHTYTSSLTVNPTSGATTFAGNIVDSTLSSTHGDVALTMSGNGELVLTGANAYSGGTTISAGTLEIAAASALPGSGLVSISGGGRLVLGSGAGIGALLSASSLAGSDAVALSAAAAPAIIGGYDGASGNMATLGGAPPLSQGGGGSRRRRNCRGRARAGGAGPAYHRPRRADRLARRRQAT